METTQLSNTVAAIPMQELASYHRQLLQQYKNGAPAPTSADALRLMTFNGYYALDNTPGAFFAIDTNMVITDNSSTPVYDVALLICLDGVTSARFQFTGTFDGANLTQVTAEGLNLAMVLTRTNGSDGTTAVCSGSITLPGQQAVTVLGNTYNNPIPASLFIGTYFQMPAKGSTAPPLKVMSIGSGNVLQWDNNAGSGQLTAVSEYVYNMKMYFFSFTSGSMSVSFIMGTASANGFACNNMIVESGVQQPISRSLQTVTDSVSQPQVSCGFAGSQLSGFSGYYQVPSLGPLAFISVQAEYATLSELLSLDLNIIAISISKDGVNSTGYYFNPGAGMTWDSATNTLAMAGVIDPRTKNPVTITLTFNRIYNSVNGSLVTLTGSIDNAAINGFTLFNPVPLTVFGGVPMTDEQGKSLEIMNMNEVVYDGITLNSIIYVPLMYILAAPILPIPNIMMSFGTDGLRGNTCIITDMTTGTAETFVVYAIPDAQGE